MNKRFVTFIILAFVLIGALAPLMSAQELTPRAYWPAPTGTMVAVFGYLYSTGDVLMDPSLPLYGVDSKIHTGVLAYLQTLSLWGRTSNIVVELPYSWGTTKGLLFKDPSRRDFSGFNDPSITLSVNLFGAPSMTPKDFLEFRANPHPILGASVKVLVPIGRYEKDKLINVGAHRWAFKPELGYIIPLAKKWLLELDLGAWFFTGADDYLPGKREQKPIIAAQVHLVRRFKAGFWASLDVNFYTGGQQTIGGNELVDVQQNSRIGGTIVVPFLGRHAIKVGYSFGVVTEFGTDFKQLLVSYQVLLN